MCWTTFQASQAQERWAQSSVFRQASSSRPLASILKRRPCLSDIGAMDGQEDGSHFRTWRYRSRTMTTATRPHALQVGVLQMQHSPVGLRLGFPSTTDPDFPTNGDLLRLFLSIGSGPSRSSHAFPDPSARRSASTDTWTAPLQRHFHTSFRGQIRSRQVHAPIT